LDMEVTYKLETTSLWSACTEVIVGSQGKVIRSFGK
jgi:hypothetical protein